MMGFDLQESCRLTSTYMSINSGMIFENISEDFITVSLLPKLSAAYAGLLLKFGRSSEGLFING